MKKSVLQLFKPITERNVNKALDKIISNLHPYKIILFGSYINSKDKLPNDLDILIVMDSDAPDYKRAAKVKMLFNPLPFPMDVIIYTPAEFKKWCGAANHIITEAIRYGKIVYERN